MEKTTNEVAIKNLLELLDEFSREKKSLEERIKLNENSIIEIKTFLDKLCSSEAEDYKFFSPRTPSALRQDSIFENRNRISFYENENHTLYVDLNIIDKRIKLLTETINALKLQSILEPEDGSRLLSANKNILTEDLNTTNTTVVEIGKNGNDNSADSYEKLNSNNKETEINNEDNSVINDDNTISNNNIINDSTTISKGSEIKIEVLESKSKIAVINNKETGHFALIIQERERERIARDLHDTSLQNLTHIIHKIELASKFIDLDSIRAKLELAAIMKSLRDIIEEIRSIIYNLRPMLLSDLGFIEIFKRMKEEYRLKSSCEINMDIAEPKECADIVKITIYRVIEEAVNNSIKHSKATKLSVKIDDSKELIHITIEDNGIGFDPEIIKDNNKKLHFGLQIMKERILLIGGEFQVENQSGTKIVIDIPKTGGSIND